MQPAPVTDGASAPALSLSGEIRFQALLESAPDAIVIIDARGVIVLINSQAERWFGYRREELIGREVEVLVPERLRTMHQEHRRRYVQEPASRPMGQGLNLVGRRKDGSEFPAEISLSPLRTEEGILVTAIIRDVSEQKRLEQQQREREMLRTEQMVALGQVAAGVAHELRNPLTSIKGLVQVNRKEAEARGLPSEDLRIIEQEIRRMERTLQAFLDFARPPQMQRKELSLAVLVEKVLALLGGRAAQQKVELRFTPPLQPVLVPADRDHLQQLVLNLVLNALEAMPKGGVIEVVLRALPDDQVEIQVLDTGTGIPDELLPRIFEPFVSSKETGLGLGLAVSRRIAEDHGGSLTAHNRPGGGACFTLRLPRDSGRRGADANAARR